jgi:hypothetical protein
VPGLHHGGAQGYRLVFCKIVGVSWPASSWGWQLCVRSSSPINSGTPLSSLDAGAPDKLVADGAAPALPGIAGAAGALRKLAALAGAVLAGAVTLDAGVAPAAAWSALGAQGGVAGCGHGRRAGAIVPATPGQHSTSSVKRTMLPFLQSLAWHGTASQLLLLLPLPRHSLVPPRIPHTAQHSTAQHSTPAISQPVEWHSQDAGAVHQSVARSAGPAAPGIAAAAGALGKLAALAGAVLAGAVAIRASIAPITSADAFAAEGGVAGGPARGWGGAVVDSPATTQLAQCSRAGVLLVRQSSGMPRNVQPAGRPWSCQAVLGAVARQNCEHATRAAQKQRLRDASAVAPIKAVALFAAPAGRGIAGAAGALPKLAGDAGAVLPWAVAVNAGVAPLATAGAVNAELGGAGGLTRGRGWAGLGAWAGHRAGLGTWAGLWARHGAGLGAWGLGLERWPCNN